MGLENNWEKNRTQNICGSTFKHCVINVKNVNSSNFAGYHLVSIKYLHVIVFVYRLYKSLQVNKYL